MKKYLVVGLTSLNLFACMNETNQASSNKQESSNWQSPSLEEFMASDENELKSFIAATDAEKEQILSLKADLPVTVMAWSAASSAVAAAANGNTFTLVDGVSQRVNLPKVKRPRVFDSESEIYVNTSAFDPKEVERSANLYDALSPAEQEKLLAWAQKKIEKENQK